MRVATVRLLLSDGESFRRCGLLDLKPAWRYAPPNQGANHPSELDHVSPLAFPVMLEIGRESVYGEASDELLVEAAEEFVREAAG
jgi:ATP-dependent helicase Lhr and Lhr-like helicase